MIHFGSQDTRRQVDSLDGCICAACASLPSFPGAARVYVSVYFISIRTLPSAVTCIERIFVGGPLTTHTSRVVLPSLRFISGVSGSLASLPLTLIGVSRCAVGRIADVARSHLCEHPFSVAYVPSSLTSGLQTIHPAPAVLSRSYAPQCSSPLLELPRLRFPCACRACLRA